tara:strand:+ start:10776 stop:11120 length:345 start_codon:yes stop_codon:yes gene_type:complete
MAGNKGKGLHSYTVQEAQNATMGQAGSVFLDSTTKDFQPTKGVVVAITMVTDCKFAQLTAESGAECFSKDATGFESQGNTISNSDVFPAGLTVYGRWSRVKISTNGEQCICYIG